MPEAVTVPAASTHEVARGLPRVLPGIIFISALWFVLCRHLSNEWSANEQYGYGWFVPFFAAYLFWLRMEGRPPCRPPVWTRRSSSLHFAIAVPLLVLLLPLRLFEVGNPDWRPLGWLHAAVVVGLTLLVIWRSGGRAWLRHFAFPICFILVAVPWVTPIEAPIVQGLMRVVASIATETLALFGVPAQLEGSVIRISSGVVGVNEACSGVRSLQTSLMIGLLFGELKRLAVGPRVALVAAAAAIAFVANCARAFFLVWIAASRGVSAVDQWHDFAGYAILGAVFLGTIGMAALLARKGESPQKVESGMEKVEIPQSAFRNPQSPFLLPTSYFLLPLLWLLFVEGAVELWYRAHERDLVSTPTWTVRWPESAAGFREVKISDDVRATLRYDDGRQAVWPLSLPNNGEPITNHTRPSATCSMFFFRWEPGTTSILRARAHRPDVCLPNTGWRVTGDHGVRLYQVGDGAAIPFRHFTFARPIDGKRELSAHAFFCQREDRIPADEAGQFNLTAGALSDWSRSDRLRVVLQGLRNQGQQVLELVMMTPDDLSGATAQAKFAELIPSLITLAPR